MIENKISMERTREARKAKEIHAPSWISHAGHVYMKGRDREILRQLVMLAANFQCAICGRHCPSWDGDLEHIKGGTKVARCDCFQQKLADGSIHTNLQWVHGMMSRNACHRMKHNREVKWTQKNISKS